MLTASIVTASLVLGLFGTTWQAIRATRAEEEAMAQRDRAQDLAEAERDAKEMCQNLLIDYTIDHAFGGDPKQTREGIEKLKLVDAPRDLREAGAKARLFYGQT